MLFDKTCPRCKGSIVRNPKIKFFVNICGHRLCESCVDVLFSRPTAPCFECGVILRRSDYRSSLFENPKIEKEVEVRKKILKTFNKTLDDFKDFNDPQKSYDDYLEKVEDLINNIDLESTKKEIDEYKRENEQIIRRNNYKKNNIDSQLQKQILRESNLQIQKARDAQIELNEKMKLVKKKEKNLIDKLSISENLGSQIIKSNEPDNDVIEDNSIKVCVDEEYPRYEYSHQHIFLTGPHLSEKVDERFTSLIPEIGPVEIAGGYDSKAYVRSLLLAARIELFFEC